MEHKWVGSGLANEAMVQNLVRGITTGGLLPGVELLQLRPEVEASALVAIDRCATIRHVGALQADDLHFLQSTAGGVQKVCDIIGDWAPCHRATFHVKQNKTVVMYAGSVGDAERPESALQHTLLVDGTARPLTFAKVQR